MVKLPGERYAWLTVVVVFRKTFVVVLSPKPTIIGGPTRQPDELTVTETDWPTNTEVGDAVTDSAAHAALDVAITPSAASPSTFTKSRRIPPIPLA
jgi:hypothetical protein